MSAPALSYAFARETPTSVRDLIDVSAALADLLMEETGYMETMQIARVGALQERKLRLTGLLERYTRYLHLHPEIMAAMTPNEKAEFRKISDKMRVAMKANYDKLMVARAVNGAVVKCVTHVLSKRNQNTLYNARGAMGRPTRAPISLTLNQTI